MCKVVNSFFSILLLVVIEFNAMQEGGLSTISIERSPSTTLDMIDFFHKTEEHISRAEQAEPQKLFCVDYNTTLLSQFARLERSGEQDAIRWRQAFKDHATRLARYHNVRNVRLHIRSFSAHGDLEIATNMIKCFGRLTAKPNGEVTALPEGPLMPLVIDQFPAGSLDMVAFFHYVEELINKAEQKQPTTSFCIDYNQTLLNFFEKIEPLGEQEKALCMSIFHDHATRLARYHHVRGMKLFYRSNNIPSDLDIIAAMVQPFLDEGKLDSLAINPLFESN